MDHLDPRSPLVISTRALTRRPGTMQELHRTVDLPDDLGTDIIAIRAGSPVRLEVRLESVVEGVLVSGTAGGTATGSCVRCLDPVVLAVEGSYQELFAYSDRAAHHHEAGVEHDDEVHELVGDLVDLEPVIRDALVPTLPFQPLCREDCPGLCPRCGARLADHPEHHHEVTDPRWSALSGLLGDHLQEKRN